ncbi:hypothetical protein JCM15457_524 [Liquorilactobacillus sucicola DSM 21376 = JCM 15457]|uniref:Transglutaminase-like domain-containing protein n=1 Tax=Liquorilactobacillus sucicola DSM 21376 = JCM 15457 TaxID=1423806 RepID=A0A023CUS0_9LACO|nr:transglutaminase family protein [Liquorilactobacillus sucicola]KRN05566.1 hypothetical protein FD15_GL002129 [Liquorilactobacillus sucicola DSM 21376 = JCM 15457]GAJ25648.1 hypothetical protein JCM15457_524 [Liquorilactobacillus sucicola DSM 21376 = JCM 15457]
MYLEYNDLNKYLQDLPELEINSVEIQNLSDKLFANATDEINIIDKAFRFVRDHIAHSHDIQASEVTRTAIEVLKAGHGICYAKSNLLAALLRNGKVPTGFCYQRLILFDKRKQPQYCIHALNAVYVSRYDRWIRIDSRGNKATVNAEFCPPKEKLAFSVDPTVGEINYPTIYAKPNRETMKTLQESTDVIQMYSHDLPEKI